MTVPDVADHPYHRFDQLAELMRDPERIAGIPSHPPDAAGGRRRLVVGAPADEVLPRSSRFRRAERRRSQVVERQPLLGALVGFQLRWVLAQSSPGAYPRAAAHRPRRAGVRERAAHAVLGPSALTSSSHRRMKGARGFASPRPRSGSGSRYSLHFTELAVLSTRRPRCRCGRSRLGGDRDGERRVARHRRQARERPFAGADRDAGTSRWYFGTVSPSCGLRP